MSEVKTVDVEDLPRSIQPSDSCVTMPVASITLCQEIEGGHNTCRMDDLEGTPSLMLPSEHPDKDDSLSVVADIDYVGSSPESGHGNSEGGHIIDGSAPERPSQQMAPNVCLNHSRPIPHVHDYSWINGQHRRVMEPVAINPETGFATVLVDATAIGGYSHAPPYPHGYHPTTHLHPHGPPHFLHPHAYDTLQATGDYGYMSNFDSSAAAAYDPAALFDPSLHLNSNAAHIYGNKSNGRHRSTPRGSSVSPKRPSSNRSSSQNGNAARQGNTNSSSSSMSGRYTPSPSSGRSRGSSPAQNRGASDPTASTPLLVHPTAPAGLPPAGSLGSGQHVVHLHVNPGETVSLQMGGQVQVIQGPATVRMVSTGSPPVPLPVQVPPGHVLQQIVDERGTLRHVILSPAPTATTTPVSSSNGPPSSTALGVLPLASPPHPPPPPSHYASNPNNHNVTGQPPPQFYGANAHSYARAYPSQQHYGPTAIPTNLINHSHQHPHIHPFIYTNSMSNSTTRGKSPPPSPPSFSDERTQKQFIKLRKKLENRSKANSANVPSADATPPSPKKDNNNIGKLKDCNQNGIQELVSSTVGNTNIQSEEALLSKRFSELKLPQVHDVSARCVTVSWEPVEAMITEPNAEKDEKDLLKDLDINYQITLGEKRKAYKEKFSRVVKECTYRFSDLQPATDYWVRLSALVDLVKIKETPTVEFQTKACPPDVPIPPLVQNRTRNSIVVRWIPSVDNGSSILYYILECDDGTGCNKFSEVYRGKNKQYTVSKLQLSTQYCLRLAAYNDMGISDWSESISVSTMGAPPAPPLPPTLKDVNAQHISLSWNLPTLDQLFTLQIADPISGHGFLNVYHGSDSEYTCTGLTRNTPYRLRLQAQNENGISRWSDEVTFSTTADRPAAPSRLSVKGRIHAHNFRIRWDAPNDTGGSSIAAYYLQLDSGEGFTSIWNGLDTEFLCDELTPGTAYHVRISCSNDVQQSEFSEPLSVITEPVCPGLCAAPRLNGKPRANSLQLKWECPEFNGGSKITQYEVNVLNPDGSTRIAYVGFDTECLVASLLPGRNYSFQVRANNQIGFGAWSPSLETLSGPGAPEPPSTPVLISRSSHSIALSWNEPLSNGSIVTEYRLEMASNSVAEASDETSMMNLENLPFVLVHAGTSTQHDIKGLHPVTTYFFRTQAVNLVGASSYSPPATFTTLASSPAAVSGLRCIAVDTTSFTLSWNVPHSNGSTITHYNIELGDKWTISTKDPTTTLHVDNLNPDTLFRPRVQAVNAIGVGPYSSVLKCSTRPLPPSPPRLECAQISHNCLKLRWGDGKNLDFMQYSVEMLKEGSEEFYLVYEGTSHSYKMSKLTECTSYKFRICARNEVGDGPYSDVLEVATNRAPPPILKKPDILDLNETNCRICWSSYRLPLHSDLVTYQIEVTRTKDQEPIMNKRCTENEMFVIGLNPRTEYSVRVFAIRSCDEGDIPGVYSPSKIFTTPSSHDADLGDTQKNLSMEMPDKSSKPLTDQHWALIIISAFIAFSILIAVVMNQLVVT